MMLERMAVPALVVALLASWPTADAGRKDEPDRVTVQHVLIGFKRSVPNKKLDRTKKEAKALADELLQRATEGEDFSALVKEYTDDNYPGIYTLTNTEAPRVPGGRQRKDMVARFGDVAFRLEVGEVGLAAYHGGLSPYGWHVIKRLE